MRKRKLTGSNPEDYEAQGLNAVDLPIIPMGVDVGASGFDRFQAWALQVPTSFEKKVWAAIGKENNVWGFKQQVPVHGYIADFLSEEYKLIIEADGPAHINQGAADLLRDANLEHLGYLTLRITPGDFTVASKTMLFDLIETFASAQMRMEE